jgi:hypothetical protein
LLSKIYLIYDQMKCTISTNNEILYI